MKRNFRLIAVTLSILFITSCAAFQVQSPIEAYAKALGVWADSATQFKLYYERADLTTQAKWDEEFRPTLIKAKDVLNIWKRHLDMGETTAEQMEQWKLLKNELIFYLATNMGG